MKKKRFKNSSDQPENTPGLHASASSEAGPASRSKSPEAPARPKSAPLSGAAFPENPEPIAKPGSIPAGLVAVLLIVLFWGDMYVMRNGGDLMGKSGSFPTNVYFPYHSFAEVEAKNPVDPVRDFANQGRLVYTSKGCVACHQPTGTGIPNQFPPLCKSEWVLAPKPDRIIRGVLNGLQGPIEVAGQPFNSVMVPWRDVLTDAEIAQVLTFVRNEWGNKAGAVKPEEVKAIREATKGKADSWTAAELKQFPDQ